MFYILYFIFNKYYNFIIWKLRELNFSFFSISLLDWVLLAGLVWFNQILISSTEHFGTMAF